jgi:hypothetical protein
MGLVHSRIKFLHGPLNGTERGVVLIWDALDECTESRKHLVELLRSRLSELPPWTKIFLTSRPDTDYIYVLFSLTRSRRGRIFFKNTVYIIKYTVLLMLGLNWRYAPSSWLEAVRLSESKYISLGK